jgi:hypothetical protein
MDASHMNSVNNMDLYDAKCTYHTNVLNIHQRISMLPLLDHINFLVFEIKSL